MLVGPTGRIVYGNREARQLLLGGGALEGRSYGELRAGCPPAMQEVMASETDGLFTVREGERAETFHLSRRSFRLNYRRHELLLLRRLTGELGRQEAEIWKKVLRVVSHELNNSLAPISSLVHSARIIASDPRHAHRADEVFATLRERLDHLQRFLDGYARFARLPRPRPEAVDWSRFLETVQDFPQVHLAGAPPSAPGWFDPAQLRQVLVNLFKNAVEASEGDGQPAARSKSLRVESAPRGRHLDPGQRPRPRHGRRDHAAGAAAVLLDEGGRQRPRPGALPRDPRGPRRQDRSAIAPGRGHGGDLLAAAAVGTVKPQGESHALRASLVSVEGMPEISRFFGIVIRMFVEAGGDTIDRTFTPTTRNASPSTRSTRSSSSPANCLSLSTASRSRGPSFTSESSSMIGPRSRPVDLLLRSSR